MDATARPRPDGRPVLEDHDLLVGRTPGFEPDTTSAARHVRLRAASARRQRMVQLTDGGALFQASTTPWQRRGWPGPAPALGKLSAPTAR